MNNLELHSPEAPKAKPRHVRSWFFAALKALAMAVLARACALSGALLVTTFFADQSGTLWAQIPGWVALVCFSKIAARAGWWNIKAAWIFSACAVLGSGLALLQGVEWMGPGWLIAVLWASLWPKARQRAIEISQFEALKKQNALVRRNNAI